MKIIKEGKTEKQEFRMVCDKCGCEALYTNEDVQRDRDGSYVVCPCCGSFVSHNTHK